MRCKKWVVFIVCFILYASLTNAAATWNFASSLLTVPADSDSPYTCQSIAEDINNASLISFLNSSNSQNCTLNVNISIAGHLNIFNETWFFNSTVNGTPTLFINATTSHVSINSSNLTNNGTVGGNVWAINVNTAGGSISNLTIYHSFLSNYGYGIVSPSFLISKLARLEIVNTTFHRGSSGITFNIAQGDLDNSINWIMENNTILQCTFIAGGSGINFAAGVQNFTIRNNTIDRCSVGIKIQTNTTLSIFITNNTIINSTVTHLNSMDGSSGVQGVGIYINASDINLTYNRFEGNNISIAVRLGGDKTLIYGNIFADKVLTAPNHYINTTAFVRSNFSSFGNFYGDAFNTTLQDVNRNGNYDSLYNESVSRSIRVNSSGVWNDNNPVVCERGWETNTSCVFLVIPANSASITSAGQNLTYFPGGSLNFTNCSLVISRSGVETTNYTNTTITAGIRRNFTVTGLPIGTFTWSVNCQTNRTSSAATLVRSSSNFTLNVSNTAPQFGYRNISGTTNITDTLLAEAANGTNFGAGASLMLGKSSNLEARVIMNFTLPSLPNASISSAVLHLYNLSSGGGSNTNTHGIMNISFYMVNNSWLEGTCSTGGGCVNSPTVNGTTWNERYNGTNWTTFGGDFYTHINESTVNFTANASSTANAPFNFTLTSLFGYWENGTYANNGVIMKELILDQLTLFNPTEGTAGRTPYVDLNFTLDPITTNDTQNVTINLTYYFNDDDAGHKLTYACQFLHGIGNCTDNKDGTVTIKPMAFGNETIIINGSDEFGATTMSNPIRIVVNDTIKPVASAGSPTGNVETSTTTLSFTSSENANCRGSLDKDESYGELDFAFSGANLSHTYSLSLVGIASGKHTIYSNCQDFPGRNYLSGSFSWTFTYSPSLGGGGGAGGGTGGGSGGDAGSEEGNTSDNQEGGEDEEEDYVVESGETVDIGLLSRTQEKGVQSAKQGRIKFDLTNDPGNYYLEIVSFSDNLLTLRYGVSKTLLTIVLGGEKQIDFNGDGLVDVIISFNAIIGNKVDLSLREISQSPERLDILEKEVSYGWAYLLVILVILIAFGYLWMQRRKKKR